MKDWARAHSHWVVFVYGLLVKAPITTKLLGEIKCERRCVSLKKYVQSIHGRPDSIKIFVNQIFISPP